MIKNSDLLKVKDVKYLDDMRPSLIKNFTNGGARGEQIPFSKFGEGFSWMKRQVNIFAGIANHGKTSFLMQLAIIKSKNDGTKWGVFSPEQNPPLYFYNDLIHAFIGKNTEPYYENQMSMVEYVRAMDFINEHFFYIYPENDAPTPEYINERFLDLINRHNITGCITDPFNQLSNDWNKSPGRDLYISEYLAKEKRFALAQNVYKIIVVHPTKLQKQKEALNYECPDVYDLAGGAMWTNAADNILFVHRPYKSTDPKNTEVLVRVSKIKYQKQVGIPGDFTFSFDPQTARYYEDGISPLDSDNPEKVPFEFTEEQKNDKLPF